MKDKRKEIPQEIIKEYKKIKHLIGTSWVSKKAGFLIGKIGDNDCEFISFEDIKNWQECLK